MKLFNLTCPLCLLILILFLYYLREFQENFIAAERYYPSSCSNLNFNQCLQTDSCGWLIDGKYSSMCLDGTSTGPLNP